MLQHQSSLRNYIDVVPLDINNIQQWHKTRLKTLEKHSDIEHKQACTEYRETGKCNNTMHKPYQSKEEALYREHFMHLQFKIAKKCVDHTQRLSQVVERGLDKKYVSGVIAQCNREMMVIVDEFKKMTGDYNETSTRNDINRRCQNCKGGDLKLNDTADLVCVECGAIVATNYVVINSVKDLYALHPRTTARLNIEKKSYTYKRLNHMRSMMKQVQGLTIHHVDGKDLEEVRTYIKTHSLASLNPTLMRAILKRMKKSSLYEHIISLCCYFDTTFQPPKFETTDILKMNMLMLEYEQIFRDMQRASETTRKNFLSYSFVLSQLYHMVCNVDVSRFVRGLKSKELAGKQKVLWDEMTRRLKIKYKQLSAATNAL